MQMLASVVLPSEILNYFSIVGVEQMSTEIHISLDEKMNMNLNTEENLTPLSDRCTATRSPQK